MQEVHQSGDSLAAKPRWRAAPEVERLHVPRSSVLKAEVELTLDEAEVFGYRNVFADGDGEIAVAAAPCAKRDVNVNVRRPHRSISLLTTHADEARR